MPFFGKSTYEDYGDFKGLKEKPIQIDRLNNSRNPLGVPLPFMGESLHDASYKPYQIGAGGKVPELAKVRVTPDLGQCSKTNL